MGVTIARCFYSLVIESGGTTLELDSVEFIVFFSFSIFLLWSFLGLFFVAYVVLTQ